MRILLAIICFAVTETLQAAIEIQNSYPQNIPQINILEEISKLKLPEDRKKLSIFPKLDKKFVITPPTFTYVTYKPTAKRTMMPKMVFVSTEERHLPETVTKRPIIKHKDLLQHIKENENTNIKENKKIDTKSEDSLAENDFIIDEDKVVNDLATLNDNGKEKSELQDIDNIMNLKTIKEEDTVVEMDKNADNEFIFMQTTESINEEFRTDYPVEDFTPESREVTTESIIQRVKRGSNIIEEENVGTTVSEYKFTWKSRELTNDRVFKNIHS